MSAFEHYAHYLGEPDPFFHESAASRRGTTSGGGTGVHTEPFASPYRYRIGSRAHFEGWRKPQSDSHSHSQATAQRGGHTSIPVEERVPRVLKSLGRIIQSEANRQFSFIRPNGNNKDNNRDNNKDNNHSSKGSATTLTSPSRKRQAAPRARPETEVKQQTSTRRTMNRSMPVSGWEEALQTSILLFGEEHSETDAQTATGGVGESLLLDTSSIFPPSPAGYDTQQYLFESPPESPRLVSVDVPAAGASIKKAMDLLDDPFFVVNRRTMPTTHTPHTRKKKKKKKEEEDEEEEEEEEKENEARRWEQERKRCADEESMEYDTTAAVGSDAAKRKGKKGKLWSTGTTHRTYNARLKEEEGRAKPRVNVDELLSNLNIARATRARRPPTATQQQQEKEQQQQQQQQQKMKKKKKPRQHTNKLQNHRMSMHPPPLAAIDEREELGNTSAHKHALKEEDEEEEEEEGEEEGEEECVSSLRLVMFRSIRASVEEETASLAPRVRQLQAELALVERRLQQRQQELRSIHCKTSHLQATMIIGTTNPTDTKNANAISSFSARQRRLDVTRAATTRAKKVIKPAHQNTAYEISQLRRVGEALRTHIALLVWRIGARMARARRLLLVTFQHRIDLPHMHLAFQRWREHSRKEHCLRQQEQEQQQQQQQQQQQRKLEEEERQRRDNQAREEQLKRTQEQKEEAKEDRFLALVARRGRQSALRCWWQRWIGRVRATRTGKEAKAERMFVTRFFHRWQQAIAQSKGLQRHARSSLSDLLVVQTIHQRKQRSLFQRWRGAVTAKHTFSALLSRAEERWSTLTMQVARAKAARPMESSRDLFQLVSCFSIWRKEVSSAPPLNTMEQAMQERVKETKKLLDYSTETLAKCQTMYGLVTRTQQAHKQQLRLKN